MAQVIDFLERVGEDAQLRYATPAELDEALRSNQIDSVLRAVILRRDREALENLLGASANICCVVHAPDDEEDEEDDKEQRDDDGGDDDEKQ
jgi:hypothetical protein